MHFLEYTEVGPKPRSLAQLRSRAQLRSQAKVRSWAQPRFGLTSVLAQLPFGPNFGVPNFLSLNNHMRMLQKIKFQSSKNANKSIPTHIKDF